MKAIGFDLDDTLYDRDRVYERIYQTMQASICELRVSFKEFNTVYQRYSLEEYQSYVNGEKSKEAYQQDRVCRTYQYFGQELSHNDVLVFQSLYGYFMERITLRPQLENLLKKLTNESIILFLFTNGTVDGQKQKIKRLGLDCFFAKGHQFISSDIGFAKPDPRVFQHVEQEIGVRGHDILFIGDHYENDILGARALNWQTIYFNIHQPQFKPLSDEGIQMVTSAKEIESLVLKIL